MSLWIREFVTIVCPCGTTIYAPCIFVRDSSAFASWMPHTVSESEKKSVLVVLPKLGGEVSAAQQSVGWLVSLVRTVGTNASANCFVCTVCIGKNAGNERPWPHAVERGLGTRDVSRKRYMMTLCPPHTTQPVPVTNLRFCRTQERENRCNQLPISYPPPPKKRCSLFLPSPVQNFFGCNTWSQTTAFLPPHHLAPRCASLLALLHLALLHLALLLFIIVAPHHCCTFHCCTFHRCTAMCGTHSLVKGYLRTAFRLLGFGQRRVGTSRRAEIREGRGRDRSDTGAAATDYGRCYGLCLMFNV